jgi:hypothetical protein
MKTPKSHDLRASYQVNAHWSVIANRVLLVGMMVSTAYSIYQFFQFAVPTWNTSYLVVLALFMTFEAMLSHHQSKRTADLDISIGMYYFVEWVVLLLLIKAFLLLRPGQPPLIDMWRTWREDISSLFLDGETLISVTTAFFTWGMTMWYLKDLDEVESEETILADRHEGLRSNRYEIRQSIITRFLLIGFFMILITVIVNLDFIALFQGTLSSHRSGAFNIILYFLLGMLLLSLTHFSVLRAGWAWERVPLDPNMIRSWFIYSLVALALVSSVAFLLPTNYSYGILSLLRYLLNVIGTILFIIILAVLSGLAGLLKLIYSLFQSSGPSVELPAMPSMPDIPEPIEQSTPAGWIKLLQSIIFWAVLIGIIVYALYQYLRQNRELVDKLRKIRGFRILGEAFRWLRERLKGFNQAAAKALSQGVQRFRALFGYREKEAFRYLSLRKLSPRQKILFYYLALVRRGGETGIKRSLSQTPYEYAQSIKRSVTEIEEPVEAITEAFVEARYSKHGVEVSQANLVRQAWDRIRQALHRMGKPRS